MTIAVDPVIGRIGPLEFGWYGVIMALGIVVGLWVASRQLKMRGIEPGHILGIAIFALPCGIVGARLVHVLENLGYFTHHPGEIFGLRMVGLAIYGVIAGALLGTLAYSRWQRLPALKVLDSAALAFPVAQIIGKCANILNGDAWGYPTDLPWGITYTDPRSFIPDELLGVATHPTPMYEQLWLVMMIVVLAVNMRRLMKVDGLAILAYLWLYSLGRFVITFWRVNDTLLWGLKEAQLIALIVLVAVPPVAYWLIRRARRARGQDVTARAGSS